MNVNEHTIIDINIGNNYNSLTETELKRMNQINYKNNIHNIPYVLSFIIIIVIIVLI